MGNQRIHPTEKGLRKLRPGDAVFLQAKPTPLRIQQFSGRFVRFVEREDETIKDVVIEDDGVVIHFPALKLDYCMRYRA